MLNPNDSRRLARALLDSNLNPSKRRQVAQAADTANNWDELPEWVRELDTDKDKETTA